LKKIILLLFITCIPIGMTAQETDCPAMDKGTKLTHEGRLKEAIPFFNQAIQQFPNRVEYLLARACANEELGAWKQAFEDYSTAIKMDSSNVDHFFLRALLAFKMNRLQIAKADLVKTISMEPTNADAYFVLGKIAWKKKQFKIAEKWFQKAMIHRKDHTDALCGLALMAAHKKQWLKANQFVALAKQSEYTVDWLPTFEQFLQKKAYLKASKFWFKQSMPPQLTMEVI